MSLEESITNARNEFEQILQYVSKSGELQQIHDVEKNIFQKLLILGFTLLKIFVDNHTTKSNIFHIDENKVKRKIHSFKKRNYLSVFGKLEINRPYYWKRGAGGLCPVDAELNLPDGEYSYLLQEWGTCLVSEQPYNKAIKFLQKFLGIQLWDSSLEQVVVNSSINIADFYMDQPMQQEDAESELLVASVDCKGVAMRKSELKKKDSRPELRRLQRTHEKVKKAPKHEENEIKTNHHSQKTGKKKMSCVTAAYTIKRNIRTPEEILANHNKVKNKRNSLQPRPESKIVYGTLAGKQVAFEHLKSEMSRRNCKNAKRIALVDGEAKLIELLGDHLPDFEIIRDIVHVKEYLWDASHVLNIEGTKEAEDWLTKRLQMLLEGNVKNIITEMESLHKKLRSKTKKKELKRIIVYLKNGQSHMKYDHYLAEGYPIGSGVIEGTCKNLVNDRCEHSGMHWTVKGANAILAWRSIHINNLEKDYWHFHIKKKREEIYGDIPLKEQNERLAA